MLYASGIFFFFAFGFFLFSGWGVDRILRMLPYSYICFSYSWTILNLKGSDWWAAPPTFKQGGSLALYFLLFCCCCWHNSAGCRWVCCRPGPSASACHVFWVLLILTFCRSFHEFVFSFLSFYNRFFLGFIVDLVWCGCNGPV